MKKVLFAMVLALVMMTACNSVPKGEDGQKGQTETNREANREWSYRMFSEDVAIRAEIKGDKVVLTYNEKAFEDFSGFDNVCHPYSEPVEVKNLKGTPRSVFISDIGNDFNPILCVLLENGDLQILGLFDCILNCDVEASEVLFHDVEYLEEGAGGCDEGEDGETICDYVTIYACSKGEKHEVML